jgi:flagellar motor switch protein FliN/FliY
MESTLENSRWIKEVTDAVASLTRHPEFNAPHAFPLEDLQNRLQVLFDRPQLELKMQAKGWMPSNALLEGISSPRCALSILFTPLTKSLYFVMSEQDLKFLMSELLGGKQACAPFYEPEQMSGFTYYLGLEVLALCDATHFAGNLSPRLQGMPENIEEQASKSECFVIDVSLMLASGSFSGRVLIPKEFRVEWNEYFATQAPPALTKEQREKVSAEISLEMGVAKLSFEEWKGVKLGDCVLLERASFDASGKGRVILTIGSQPIFRGKLQQEGIKLLEYPIYEEVGESMDDKFENDEELDLYGDIEGEAVTPEVEEKVQAVEPKEPIQSIPPEKIPVLLTVEAGRLRMSVEELMKLTPGTLLPFKAHPEQGVDLVVNGKRVGRGELVKIGDALGVRILQL